jgi:hypothetical protein
LSFAKLDASTPIGSTTLITQSAILGANTNLKRYEKRHDTTLHGFSLTHHAQSEFHRLTEVEKGMPMEPPEKLNQAILEFLVLCLEDSSLKAVGSWDLAQILKEAEDNAGSER